MEGLAKHEKRLSIKEARYILSSRTKDSDIFRQIVHSLYLDHLKRHPGTAPQKDADEEKPKNGELLDMVKKARAEQTEMLKKLERMSRNLYEKQTGQKWQPSLAVVPDCGKAKASKSQGRHRPPILTVIQGGGEVLTP